LRHGAALAGLATAIAMLTIPGQAAWAAGTGGIELNPVPPLTPSGQPVNAFHVSLRSGQVGHQRMLLRNVQAADASARIYAASATASPAGEYGIGGPGSAPWLGLQPFTVTLHARQQQTVDFTVRRPHAGVAGALVVEVTRGSITERAATLVLVTRRGPDRTRPLLLISVAAVLVVGAGALAYRHRMHSPPAGEPYGTRARIRSII